MKKIAARNVIAVHKESKERREIAIEISLPYPVDNGKNYFCRINFKGIDGESQDIGGVDSLQALTLAIDQLRIRFEKLQKIYTFFWPEDNAPMESFDYVIKETN